MHTLLHWPPVWCTSPAKPFAKVHFYFIYAFSTCCNPWTARLKLLLVICLDTPPRPTWGHFVHVCDQAPRPHILINSPNKGADRLGLSWGFKINFTWEWQKNYGAPPQIISEPPKKNKWPHFCVPAQNRLILYQSIALDTRISSI
jgi:hypothetical protein